MGEQCDDRGSGAPRSRNYFFCRTAFLHFIVAHALLIPNFFARVLSQSAHARALLGRRDGRVAGLGEAAPEVRTRAPWAVSNGEAQSRPPDDLLIGRHAVMLRGRRLLPARSALVDPRLPRRHAQSS